MIKEFEFNGHKATVILPDDFNGKWVWKTEFFYAFDKAEQTLLDKGYARVYYGISNMYGSDRAVRLMHAFHLYLIEKLGFKEKPFLFGFSRGGLYAFNYALYYPEYVGKIYLDAPVLNLKSWPPKGTPEHTQMLAEYGMTEGSFKNFRFSPIDNLEEFSRNNIPVLIVAGGSDSVVPYKDNCLKMVDFYKSKGLEIKFILKPECEHHPHSLDDVSPIIDFIESK